MPKRKNFAPATKQDLKPIQDDIKSLKAGFKNLDQKVNALDQKVNALDQKVNALDQKVNTMDQTLKNVALRVVRIEEKLTTLATKEEMDSRFNQVLNQMDGLAKLIKDSERGEAFKWGPKYIVLTEKVDDHEGRLTKLEATLQK